MRFYERLYNRRMINELRNELNTDVVLFSADGSAFYGHLQGLDDCHAAILTPATCAESCNVETVSSGGCFLTSDFTRICLNNIVAKSSGICGDPLAESDDLTRDLEIPDELDRDGGYIYRQLQRLIGDRTIITLIGGFAFEGIISAVCDDILILTVDTVCLPSCCDDFDENKIRSVIINMNAITSFGSSNCCKKACTAASCCKSR
jgi:small nuclear ribonucleoprotein (snRNP)-like protein